jgi:ribonuclease D
MASPRSKRSRKAFRLSELRIRVKKNMDNTYQLIETGSDLADMVNHLVKRKAIAVDLESDSMYHFREKVCLLQIASKAKTFIIDPLKLNDVTALHRLFSDKKIKKIFHGADYDIRSLFRDFQFEVHNLFDTQLASRFLGFEETSLEALLQRFFEISLNKHYQKKDWSRRPIPEEMVDYAAKDVSYLLALAAILTKRLKELDRLHWVREECRLLSQVRPAMNNNSPLCHTFKGAGSLHGKDLAILEAILQVRKKFAEKKDRPLFKIFQNAAVIKIARFKPQNEKRLADISALSPSQIDMYGASILQAIQEAQILSPRDYPQLPRKEAVIVKAKEQERIRVLKDWKETKSKQLNIEGGLILGKPVVASIAAGDPKSLAQLKRLKEIRNWQLKEFGEEIISFLNA